ncbi:esterase/lipase family protein [Sphingomonas sp. Sphisp140]|uniref:esterase/lipase family protein n=1 Tax=unclassified Sphingomonas TaxID=196159 RepID=UPI0039B01978
MTVLRTLPTLAIGLMLSSATLPVAAGMPSAAAGKCTGGWAGSVRYSRTFANSSSKTVQRVSGTGSETSNWSMNSTYTAQVSVRATPDPDISLARANISMSSVSKETKSSNDRRICPHEKTMRAMSGSFVDQSQVRATGNGEEAEVSVGLDDEGTYRVGISLPSVEGISSGSSSSSYSGQCTAREGRNLSVPDTPTTVDGVRFSSSGTDRVSPSAPDQLSGSHSVSLLGVTETMSWNLRRCGGALRLVDLKFEDMKFPTWNAWKEITEQVGTIDGNLVRVTATVANDGAEEKAATVKFKDTYKGDKWDGAKPDGLLEESSVMVPAGEEREVTFTWDSSGYAWFDDGRPRLMQRIKAELEDKGKKIDEQTRNLKVAPKPMMLVHGLWSTWETWESWQNVLTSTHSYDWKAFPVGQKPEHGRMNTGFEVGYTGPTYSIDQNAEQLKNYIDYAQKERNAWHVDIVAHSMGGLISRRYIHASMPIYEDEKPQVSNLVMLGTPNMGSRCANILSVPLETAGRSMEALRELRPSTMERFNAIYVARKGVKFSVLAGNPLPTFCYMFEANDGVVTVSSATWKIADNEQKSILHTNMTTPSETFSAFVKSRVALGPKKQAPAGTLAALMPQSRGMPSGLDLAFACLELLGIHRPADPDQAVPDFSKIVKLDPGQAVEIAIPVKEARNFGLTFAAANTVSATLIDDKGAVAGANLAGKPEASQIFRSIFVNRPVAQGNWKLRLQNDGAAEREVILSTWSNAS